MTSRDFCFWLQGYFEVSGSSAMDREQADIVKRHLSLVFKHEIDPAMGGPEKQAKLSDLHSPNPTYGPPAMRC